MKIILALHQFLPDNSTGTEILTYSVAKEFINRGHEVIIFTAIAESKSLADWQRFDFYEYDGISVYRFHHSYTPSEEQEVISEIEYNNHLTARFFSHLLDIHRPDIIHFFHFMRLGVSLVDVAQSKSIPVYFTPTDFWSICPTVQLIRDEGQVCAGPTAFAGNCIKHIATRSQWPRIARLARHLPNWAIDTISLCTRSRIPCPLAFRQEIAALSYRLDFIRARINSLHAIISPTKLMTEILVRHNVDKQLIIQSPFGLNISSFKNEPKEFNFAKPLNIGYIGTLSTYKGCEVLIKAFLLMPYDKARLCIYGNLNQYPGYVAQLKSLAKGHDNIAFLGTFPNSEISTVLSSLDILVVPSLWYENTPLVVYSALAAKCPVIASNFPGISEVVLNGHNGLTFEPGNVEALKRCLNRLLVAPGLLKSLSDHCEKPKSIAAYVDELLDIYGQKDRQSLHPLFAPLVFDDYQPITPSGHIEGWAAIGLSEPRSIRALNGDKEIGRVERLRPRPDVRSSLRRIKPVIRGLNYGFSLDINEPILLSTLLEIEDKQGRKWKVSLSNLSFGQVNHVSESILVALDSAYCSAAKSTNLMNNT